MLRKRSAISCLLFISAGIWSILELLKKHIGLYPSPSAMTSFDEELKPYKRAKRSVNFPLDEPIPYDLIDKIVRFRVKENLQECEKD